MTFHEAIKHDRPLKRAKWPGWFLFKDNKLIDEKNGSITVMIIQDDYNANDWVLKTENEIPGEFDDDMFPLEFDIYDESLGCLHIWVWYNGLTDMFEYCSKCGDKKNG